MCIPSTDRVFVDVFVQAKCPSTTALLNHVYDLVDAHDDASRLTVSISAIANREKRAEYSSTRGLDEVLGGIGFLCAQAPYPQGIDSTMTDLLRCITGGPDVKPYEYSNYYESRIQRCGKRYPKFYSRCPNIDVASKYLDKSIVNSIVYVPSGMSPAVFINGEMYCGELTYEALENAVCQPTVELGANITTVPDEYVGPRIPLHYGECGLEFADEEGRCALEDGTPTAHSQKYPMYTMFIITILLVVYACISSRRRHRQMSRGSTRRSLESSSEVEMSDLNVKHQLTEFANRPLPTKHHDETRPTQPHMDNDRVPDNDDDDDVQCTICLDVIDDKHDDRYYVLDCGHVFHSECLDQWIQRKNECPVCRRTIINMNNGGGDQAPSSRTGTEMVEMSIV